MVARQGQIGKQWQYRLLPIYGVYFLNFKLPEFTDFRTDVVLANERTGKVFNRDQDEADLHIVPVIQFKQGGVQELLRTLDLYIEEYEPI